MTTDLHPWAADLQELHAQVWTRLIRGVRDRRAPGRHPTLATVSPDGWPQARTVVLRAADQAAGTLDIHTDLQSAKVAEVRQTPCAAIHIWDASAHLQMRLVATVAVLSGDAVAEVWAKVPEVSRRSYGSHPAPGQGIAQALDYAIQPDPDRFGVLRLTVQSIDAVHLGPNHRRARFDRETDWAGTWLAP